MFSRAARTSIRSCRYISLSSSQKRCCLFSLLGMKRGRTTISFVRGEIGNFVRKPHRDRRPPAIVGRIERTRPTFTIRTMFMGSSSLGRGGRDSESTDSQARLDPDDPRQDGEPEIRRIFCSAPTAGKRRYLSKGGRFHGISADRPGSSRKTFREDPGATGVNYYRRVCRESCILSPAAETRPRDIGGLFRGPDQR